MSFQHVTLFKFKAIVNVHCSFARVRDAKIKKRNKIGGKKLLVHPVVYSKRNMKINNAEITRKLDTLERSLDIWLGCYQNLLEIHSPVYCYFKLKELIYKGGILPEFANRSANPVGQRSMSGNVFEYQRKEQEIAGDNVPPQGYLLSAMWTAGEGGSVKFSCANYNLTNCLLPDEFTQMEFCCTITNHPNN
ncbi:hypothetical protein WN51_14506 [Melipona quadrifasciata]|uniref:Uncharacterized protein n=1 Tax=Melipona quadrifasciata TaxID=166423 RepID=A0A0M8ZY27_9HYME|nr:hypothetical protein WN51_14506 [Melipona quadrifasciata]